MHDSRLYIHKILAKREMINCEKTVNVNQSELQFGFTSGLSPTMSSLICTEVINEAEIEGKPLYLVTIDTQKAFDCVNHVILKKTLFEEGVAPDLWNIVDELYSKMSSKIKWQGECSESFTVNQGVRQGGILSTSLYKMYVNPLQEDLKRYALGAHIGTIYTGCLVVADDFLLLSNCPEELQLMFNLVKGYAGERRYKIHPLKTTLVSRVSTRTSRIKDKDRKWNMGDKIVTENSKTEHLGIIRSSKGENAINIQKRTKLARRTMYSLVKTGVHGCNGLNAKISYKIYQVYVVPRLLYGLEVLLLNKGQLEELEKFHIENLKNIQSLPTRTANSIVYLLLGALPLKAEIEKRQLGLFYSVIKSENSTLQQLWKRQFMLKQNGSFFGYIAGVIEKYHLPSANEILLLSKEGWKLLVKKTLRVYWEDQLRKEAEKKSTLERCHLDSFHIGSTHPVWDTVNSNRVDVMRAIVKVRILTGTYLLQMHRKKFRMDGVTDACCPLCYLEDEDIGHMLIRCPALNEVRITCINELKKCIQTWLGTGEWTRRIRNTNTLVQLIVDCRKLVPDVLPDTTEMLNVIERKSRLLCYKLHLKRLFLTNVNRDVSRVNMAPAPISNI